MEIFTPQFFVLTLALVGVVIIIAALLSGLIDRSDLPQVGVFLALGAILGPAGLGLLNVTLDSPILRVVATLRLRRGSPSNRSLVFNRFFRDVRVVNSVTASLRYM